ncbi:hypothetical protein Q5752_001117 [Cryptotrichosporon argae]
MSDLTAALQIDSLFSVKDTTVLITGGGSGLGEYLATAFAVNGARVITVGRRKDVLEATAAGIAGDVKCVQGDVSTKAGAESIIAQVKGITPVLDTVINCAGISIPFHRPSNDHTNPEANHDMLASVEDDDFAASHRVNVNGPYFMTVSAIPLLRKSENPSVVIVSSVAGLANQRANAGFTYGVSKAGAVHLSSMLAGRLHEMKIRVNCICPGLFPSAMTAVMGDDGQLQVGGMGAKAAMRSTIGRPGKPEEIAAPVLLLASKGGMYMNDTCINVDGGRWLVMKGIYDGLRLPEESYI